MLVRNLNMFLFYVFCIYVWEIGEILYFYGRLTFLPAMRSSWGLNIIANLPSFLPFSLLNFLQKMTKFSGQKWHFPSFPLFPDMTTKKNEFLPKNVSASTQVTQCKKSGDFNRK